MDDAQLREVFRFGLTKFLTDDDGLTRTGNDPLELKTMMAVTAAIRAATADATPTLAGLRLHHCATLTEQLIGAWGIPDRRLTREWLLSCGELSA